MIMIPVLGKHYEKSKTVFFIVTTFPSLLNTILLKQGWGVNEACIEQGLFCLRVQFFETV